MNAPTRWFVFIFLSLTGIHMNALAQQPKALPGAVVSADNVRFTVLTQELIRMEWSATRTFEDRASLVFLNRTLTVPAFTVNETTDELTINTDKLILRYKKGTGRFTPDNLSVRLIVSQHLTVWKPGMVDSLNLKGTTRTLDGTDGEKDVQLEQGLLSRAGWALVDDSQRPLFDGSEWNWVVPRPPGDRQDWYFFGYGHNYKKALFDFTQVAGKIPMPPKFAFGYWWSRYWTYSDEELRSLIGDMHRYGVPIDVLIIDMDWHETYGLSVHGTKRDPFGQSVGWTGYTWNRNLFPEPEKFLAWTKDQHLKAALNLHPASGISPLESQYDDFAKRYGFDTTGRKYIPFRVEDKKWCQTYFDAILTPLEKQGVDFWWLDWQAWLDNKAVPALSNTWWLNYVFFTEMERQGRQRPILFHRWGGLGNHRYQIGFSGDSWSTWEALAYQPYFTATAGNVGYGYWSHDIGGHLRKDLDPELYLRWIQWGVLSPILRTHSTKSSEIERRIWRYGDYFPMMRQAILFRYALVPYIYTEARKAYDTGISLCRPMYYDYPEVSDAYEATGEYMFGDDLLSAPVTAKSDSSSHIARKKIWLPPGHWYEFFTGSMLDGNRTVERSFAPDEMPLYARAGAIIPMYPPVSNLQQPIDTLCLTMIPGGDGAASVYEDDGVSNAYTTAQHAFTKVTQQVRGSERLIRIGAREGSYANAPKERMFRILLPRTYPPAEVRVNGSSYERSDDRRPKSWMYDAEKLTTCIELSAVGADQQVELSVKFAPADTAREPLLDGMQSLFSRLPRIIEMMKDEVNRHDQIANAPRQVLKLGSLPSRIQYHPENAGKEISMFRDSLAALYGEIMNYPRGDQRVLKAILDEIPFEKNIAPAPVIHLDAPVSPGPGRAEISIPPGATVRYTLDGAEPDEQSAVVSEPLTLPKTATLKAKTFIQGMTPSFTVSEQFHRVYATSVVYAHPNSPRYSGGGEFGLVDGSLGSVDDYRTNWVGFQQVDLIATVRLTSPRALSAITTRFLQNQESWIFLPGSLVYEVSADGVRYKRVFEKDLEKEAQAPSEEVAVKSFKADISERKVAYVRVTAKNIGVCPPWHEGAGGKAWIFTDEIVIQ